MKKPIQVAEITFDSVSSYLDGKDPVVSLKIKFSDGSEDIAGLHLNDKLEINIGPFWAMMHARNWIDGASVNDIAREAKKFIV